MSNTNFYKILKSELNRLDEAAISKRDERVIENFTPGPSPKALISGKIFQVFNSNDYLGLRHSKKIKSAESMASNIYGTGPGAVRFISGALKIHTDLEKELATFHDRDDAIIFSSAFAANLAVLSSLLKKQSKDSVVDDSVLVISDELNHRSIIDGIRLAGLPKSQRKIFKHMDVDDLEKVLSSNTKNFSRVVVVTDGVFSMLGSVQKLKEIKAVIKEYEEKYPNGVLLVVDDCHGVGAFGTNGRGIEEVTKTKSDILVGTLGKAFGADGGYVVGKQVVIDYLREASSTYIYSNSISPGTAGAALASVDYVNSRLGLKLLAKLKTNIEYFKVKIGETDLEMAAESDHPIQPVLIGDSVLSQKLSKYLYEDSILVTSINYPVVPKGRDEIRIQISASHTKKDIETLVDSLKMGMTAIKK